MRPLRPQPDHLAIAALALLALVFWGNCLWGGKVPVAAVYQKQMLPWSAVSEAGGETRQWDSLLWDSMAQFYPWRVLLHNAAQKGELPLWNPYQFCGYPFVGNGQSAMFYPLNWLYFIIHPKLGMGLSAALHFFLGSLFVFGLARTWRLSIIPATFAAVAFAYGGFMVTWIELPTLVNSLIWLPLAWWGIELIFRAEGPSFSRPAVSPLMEGPATSRPAVSPLPEGPHAASYPASGPLATTGPSSTPPTSCHPERSEGPCLDHVNVQGKVLRCAQDDKQRYEGSRTRGLLMLATALGLTLLAGHFQIAAYVWIFAAVYAIIRLIPSLRRPQLTRVLATVTIAAVLAGMLATVQLLPTLELGQRSARGAGGPSAGGFEFHRQRALQPIELLTLLQADFLGTPVDGTYRGISYSEHCPFVGATTILLGLIGLALGWRRKHLWLFFGIAIFALWGAMAGPPAMLLYWFVPKLGQAGGFSRLLSIWTLSAALWGAAGLQIILDRLSATAALPAVAVSSVGRGLVPRRPFLFARLFARRLSRPQDAQPERPCSGLKAPQTDASASGGAAPHSLASAGRLAAGPAVAAIALLLLAVELLPWAYRFNPRAEAGAVYPETETVRQLRKAVGDGRYIAMTRRDAWGLVDVPTRALLPPNSATVYGLQAFDGYDSLFPASYRRAAAEAEGADPSPISNGNMLLLNGIYSWPMDAVVAPSTGGLIEGDPDYGWHRVYEGEGCAVYTNRLSGSNIAWTEIFRALPSGGRMPSMGLANIARPGLGTVDATFDATGGTSDLIIMDTFYPGWQAWCSGRRVPIRPRDAWQAVPLAGSETRVNFVYFPASVACGLFITLLAFAALTALATARLRRCTP